MSDIYVNLTDAYLYIWNICLEVWAFTDSIHINLGPISFTLFHLFISLIAIAIIWEMVCVIFWSD